MWSSWASQPDSDSHRGTRIGRIGEIPRDKLDIKFVRSPGPGGQNVNKVSTKAELRFMVSEASWIPEPVRERFVELHRNRINKEGELVISCCEHRTQQSNLNEVIQKLSALLEDACFVPKERIETKVPEYAIEYRLKQKKRRSEIKQSRNQRWD